MLGREGDEAKAGHLHWAKVEHFFVNAYVMPRSGLADPEQGPGGAGPDRRP